MIDIAWSEFLFIAILALILIGPKELPTVLRYVGRWVGKARAFMHEVSSKIEYYSHHNPNFEKNTSPKEASAERGQPLPEDRKP